MRSQTVLTMPVDIHLVHQAVIDFEHGGETDLQLKACLESSVSKWLNTISDVLKQSPNMAFANNAKPNPRVEVEFWNHRKTNLCSIYDQLRDPRVKKMAEYLEMTNSVYTKAYSSMYKNVIAAYVEAKEICLYLKPLDKHIRKFDEELLECGHDIKPLLHCLGKYSRVLSLI